MNIRGTSLQCWEKANIPRYLIFYQFCLIWLRFRFPNKTKRKWAKWVWIRNTALWMLPSPIVFLNKPKGVELIFINLIWLRFLVSHRPKWMSPPSGPGSETLLFERYRVQLFSWTIVVCQCCGSVSVLIPIGRFGIQILPISRPI